MTDSIDFCRKVSEIKERDGLSSEKVAVRFGVGKSGVSRRAKRPESRRTRNKPAAEIDMKPLERDIELYPDTYRYERAGRFGCSRRGTGEAALKRLGISREKNT